MLTTPIFMHIQSLGLQQPQELVSSKDSHYTCRASPEVWGGDYQGYGLQQPLDRDKFRHEAFIFLRQVVVVHL